MNVNGVEYVSVLVNLEPESFEDMNLITNAISLGPGENRSYQMIGFDARPDRGASGTGPFEEEIFGFNYFRLGVAATNPQPNISNRRRVIVFDGTTREIKFNSRAGIGESNDVIAAVNSVTAAAPADPFDTWATEQNIPEGETAPEADPDGDGISNLLEYAYGTNPTQPSQAQAPRVVGNQLIFQRSTTADVTPLSVMSSTTLTNFESYTATEMEVTAEGDIEIVTITVPEEERRFFILSTNRPS